MRRLPPLPALFALILLLFLAACQQQPSETAPPELRLEPVSFTELPGWQEDDPLPALPAFLRSCAVFAKRDPDRPMGNNERFGTVADWQAVCREAGSLPQDGAAVRRFFETRFLPYRITDRGEAEGLFTGYYEPLLYGSVQPDARFRYPLYRRPPELVTVELGRFDPELDGKRIAGRLDGGRLLPFPDRAAITDGALEGRGLELVWVDDPIALFFLHIQGSGQILLPDGSRMRVGYDGWNGRPYRAIGRELIARGEIPREEMSLFAIRDWLKANPEEARALLDSNPSYVFFRELSGLAEASGPPGSMGVPLSPGRSLAVDRRFVPLGLPLWLDSTVPTPDGLRPLRRLMIAQDTGGAIKGPVRGDVFWGAGAFAEYLAAHMKQPGRLYILLPRGPVPGV